MRGCKRHSNQIARHKRRATSLKDIRYTPFALAFLKFMSKKHLKAAIHNFTHSFMSIDYTRSGRLAINVLIQLELKGKSTQATFDILNKKIDPEEALDSESIILLEDYGRWLPEHLHRHNFDSSSLEILRIQLHAAFDQATEPVEMPKTVQFPFSAHAIYQSKGRPPEELVINQTELILKEMLESGIPEIH